MCPTYQISTKSDNPRLRFDEIIVTIGWHVFETQLLAVTSQRWHGLIYMYLGYKKLISVST